MTPRDDRSGGSPRGMRRRWFVQAIAAAGIGSGVSTRSLARQDDETEDDPTLPSSRPASVRDFPRGNYEHLYADQRRRSLELLLSDPEVHDIVEDMIVSYEAYEPHTNDLDAVSVQGSPGVEVDGGLEEGRFDVTFEDVEVAHGLVDREANELIALTLTRPADVSWTVTEGEGYDDARLQRVLEDSQVQEYLDDNDWFPATVDPELITSARGVEHGDVMPVVLAVVESDALTGIVAYLQVEDGAGDVIDVSYVERFVTTPLHERAEVIEPADDTVFEDVPAVPREQRPRDTAEGGTYLSETPSGPVEAADWTLEWDEPTHHGVEITAAYQGETVLESLQSPITFVGYGLDDRGDDSTLEWFFPDANPVFGGELLRWDVHSATFGGPEPFEALEYPELDGLPEGVALTSQYRTGSVDPEFRDHYAGQRFGQTNHEISYEFWADGVVIPVWKRHGPGFETEYDDSVERAIASFAMEVTPGGETAATVELSEGDEWITQEEEFYQVGESGTAVRFTDEDGAEAVEIPLEEGMEAVVASRGPREIPVQHRLEEAGIETGFYHPAQYVGGESIQNDRTVCWLLLEAPTEPLSDPAGSGSTVAHAEIQVSDDPDA